MNSAQATNTDTTLAAWICGLLQAGDSFYPTGSYAHSFGLEGLIQAGIVHDRASLRELVQLTVLPTLMHAELPIVAQAWRAFDRRDWATVRELAVLSSALRTAQETRTASENIGRQRAELAASLHPESIAVDYVNRARAEGWPFASTVSAALEAHAVGAPLQGAMAGYAYSSLSALIAAAMKLLRLGQNGAQSLLAESLAGIPDAITTALQTPIEEIGWFSPWLDIASARHEVADARMFIS